MSKTTSVASVAAAPSQLLDVEAVAALLDCSPRHVRRLADTGRMPAPLKLGALCRWDRKLVLAWISEGCPHCRQHGDRN